MVKRSNESSINVQRPTDEAIGSAKVLLDALLPLLPEPSDGVQDAYLAAVGYADQAFKPGQAWAITFEVPKWRRYDPLYNADEHLKSSFTRWLSCQWNRFGEQVPVSVAYEVHRDGYLHLEVLMAHPRIMPSVLPAVGLTIEELMAMDWFQVADIPQGLQKHAIKIRLVRDRGGVRYGMKAVLSDLELNYLGNWLPVVSPDVAPASSSFRKVIDPRPFPSERLTLEGRSLSNRILRTRHARRSPGRRPSEIIKARFILDFILEDDVLDESVLADLPRECIRRELFSYATWKAAKRERRFALQSRPLTRSQGRFVSGMWGVRSRGDA